MELTVHQIAEAFPEESKEYIPKILIVLRSKIIKQREDIRNLEDLGIDPELKKIHRMFIDYSMPQKISNMIKKYNDVLEIIKRMEDDKYINNMNMIAKAKAKPIEHLHDFEKKREQGNRILACCPLHGDKKPSFMIYKQTNSFNCFSGCGGGDAITFYMKLYNLDFNSAVKAMQ